MRVSFFVPGRPVQQGSKRAVNHPALRKAVLAGNHQLPQPLMFEQNSDSLGPWRSDVKAFARGCYAGPVLDVPVFVELSFSFDRPKSHYGTGKNADKLKSSSPLYHDQTPDLDKLVRAVFDAITGVLIRDDSQVCYLTTRKTWGDPGVQLTVETAGGPTNALQERVRDQDGGRRPDPRPEPPAIQGIPVPGARDDAKMPLRSTDV